MLHTYRDTYHGEIHLAVVKGDLDDRRSAAAIDREHGTVAKRLMAHALSGRIRYILLNLRFCYSGVPADGGLR